MKAVVVVDHVPQRAKAYAPVPDQLELLYKGYKEMLANGESLAPSIAAWVASIDAVKVKFPKKSTKQPKVVSQ